MEKIKCFETNAPQSVHLNFCNSMVTKTRKFWRLAWPDEEQQFEKRCLLKIVQKVKPKIDGKLSKIGLEILQFITKIKSHIVTQNVRNFLFLLYKVVQAI